MWIHVHEKFVNMKCSPSPRLDLLMSLTRKAHKGDRSSLWGVCVWGGSVSMLQSLLFTLGFTVFCFSGIQCSLRRNPAAATDSVLAFLSSLCKQEELDQGGGLCACLHLVDICYVVFVSLNVCSVAPKGGCVQSDQWPGGSIVPLTTPPSGGDTVIYLKCFVSPDIFPNF